MSITRPISQTVVETKLHYFINAIGGKSLDEYKGGICNAFAFLTFRALLLKLQDKNIERMQKLMDEEKETIENKAKAYADYKANRLALIEDKGDERIQRFNDEIKQSEQQWKKLRETKQFEKATQLFETLKKHREEREYYIQGKLKEMYSEIKWREIQEAKMLYKNALFISIP